MSEKNEYNSDRNKPIKVEKDDSLQLAIGKFGLWQIVVCIIAAACRIPTAWHQLAIIFIAPKQDFWCSKPLEYENITTDEWKNISRPKSDRGTCEMYNATLEDLLAGLTGNTTVPCKSWEFDTSEFTYTIAQQWNLVCSQEMWVHFTQAIFMSGMLFGSAIIGHIADAYGRKKPLLACLLFQFTFGIGASFTTNFKVFMLLRFIIAFATSGVVITGFVIVMEIVGKSKRSVASVLFHTGFVIGLTSMPGISYLLRDWRHYNIAQSAPSALLFILTLIVPESPRWLLLKGRNAEATKILKTAARWNKLPTANVDNALAELKKSADDERNVQKGTVLDLMRHRVVRKRTLIIALSWLGIGVSYFGLTEYVGQIGSDIFVSLAVAGLLQFPTLFIARVCAEKLGRKATVLLPLAISGIACFILPTLPSGEGVSKWPIVGLAISGVILIEVSFPIVFLYSGELLPTVVRNVGLGCMAMTLRLGSICAPLIIGLDKVSPVIPPLIFGAIPLLSAVLGFYLPETLGTSLPDTVEELEEQANNSKKVKSFKGEINQTYIVNDEFEQSKL